LGELRGGPAGDRTLRAAEHLAVGVPLDVPCAGHAARERDRLARERSGSEIAAEDHRVGRYLLELTKHRLQRGGVAVNVVERRYEQLRGLVGVARGAGQDGLLGALVEALTAALDRVQELVQIDLERREDAVGPVLHLEARLAGGPPSLV